MADHHARFKELIKKPVTEQARFFLRPFVLEFQAKFGEVLDMAEKFRSFSSAENKGAVCELEETDAHLFLEKCDQALTVRALRDYLREIGCLRIETHARVAYLEYLMLKYRKTLPQLFAPPPEGVANQALVDKVNQAIEAYIASQEAQRKREEEMRRLELEAAGKRSVASVQAANKKNELAGQEFSQKFAEMQALKRKKEAEEALARAPKIDPYQEEQKRLAAEKRAKEEAEKKAREDSRSRLAAKAALWK